MKSGSNRAVLVSELIMQDGPFESIADDFVVGRCSVCAADVGDDAFFIEAGFVCGDCARRLDG